MVEETKQSKEIFITYIGMVNEESNKQFIQGLVSFLNKNQQVDMVHLIMSTKGGDVDAGITLYNFLISMPITLKTYNIGNVDSIGVIVFLTGQERYMTEHSSFILHGIRLEIRSASWKYNDLKEHMSITERLENKISDIIISRTEMKQTDIKRYHSEGESLGAEMAKSHKLVTGIAKPPLQRGSVHLVFGSIVPGGKH